MVTHGPRIDLVEVVDAAINRGGEITPQRLADDGPLLARDALEVFVL